MTKGTCEFDRNEGHDSKQFKRDSAGDMPFYHGDHHSLILMEAWSEYEMNLLLVTCLRHRCSIERQMSRDQSLHCS